MFRVFHWKPKHGNSGHVLLQNNRNIGRGNSKGIDMYLQFR